MPLFLLSMPLRSDSARLSPISVSLGKSKKRELTSLLVRGLRVSTSDGNEGQHNRTGFQKKDVRDIFDLTYEFVGMNTPCKFSLVDISMSRRSVFV